MKSLGRALVVAVACKGDDPRPPDPPPGVDPDIATIARYGVGRSIPIGCHGWSPSKHVAACVTGTIGPKIATTTMHFIGGDEPPVKLGAKTSAETITAIDDALAKHGIKALATFPAPIRLVRDLPLTAGRAALSWITTNDEHVVSATCNNEPIVVVRVVAADGSSGHSNAYVIGGHVIVTLAINFTRDGQPYSGLAAAVLDVKTCNISSAG